MNDDQKEVQVDGEAPRLTPIEYNILLLLIKESGPGIFHQSNFMKISGMKKQLALTIQLLSTSGISGKRLRSIPRSPGI